MDIPSARISAVSGTDWKLNLAILPFDVQVLIMEFLDPRDVLRLRMTCKSLFRATIQRTVWIRALERLCTADSIFRASYLTEKMSLTDLEDAVIAPTRWLSFVSNSQRTADNILIPSQTRILELSELAKDPDPDRESPSLYLVPGGRFLITVAKSIAIFDVSCDYASPRFIAETVTPFSSNRETFLVHSSTDGEGIRIFVSQSLRSNSSSTHELASFSIYEVFPNHQNPGINKIASLDGILESDVHFWSLSFDRLIFLEGSILKIWDYKADTWGHWKVSQSFEQIVVSEDSLILLCRSQISIWKVTALLNQKPRFSGDPPSFSPNLEIPYPLPIFDVDDVHDCTGPCDWYSGTAQPLLYDLIHPQDSVPQLSRFEVVFDEFGHAELLSLATLEMPNDPIFEPYRFSQGTLTTWWHDGTHIRAYISSSKGLPMAKTVLLFEVDVDWDINISSFCPSSGRLVCLDHEQTIHVIDFLTPRPR